MIVDYTVHFTLCYKFSGRGTKYRKRIDFMATRYKFSMKERELFFEVAQIILGFTHLVGNYPSK